MSGTVPTEDRVDLACYVAGLHGWKSPEDYNRAEEGRKALLQRPPRWKWHGVKHSKYDDAYTLWWVFDREWSNERIEAEIARFGFITDAVGCNHDYDCCGHWFSDGLWILRQSESNLGSGRVLHTTSWAVARMSWARNV
jgi:hypothetical protein